jgi:small subunit ribosomal protein S25e
MPKAVEKKSKDSIAKAATQKSGGTKKWTKGKVKEKADNAVFLDRASYDRILAAIPKLGKHISTSAVIEKFKIVGSIARILLRKAVENGSIKSVESHSKQTLYTPIAQLVDTTKPVVAETKEAGAKKEKAPKKEKK